MKVFYFVIAVLLSFLVGFEVCKGISKPIDNYVMQDYIQYSKLLLNQRTGEVWLFMPSSGNTEWKQIRYSYDFVPEEG